MKYRTLGRSGTLVSVHALGTMTFGAEADEATSGEMMDAFVEAGGNFFDTADVYSRGISEEIIGRWLKEHPTEAGQVVLATKGRFPMGEGPNDLGLSRRHLREALAAGADGYLLKSVAGADLAAGIRNAVAGETVIGQEFVPKLLEDAQRGVPMGQPDVTKREQEVLELVAEGMANREIAEQLGISARTAQKHLENLFKKFSVHDRTELVAHAFRRGLLG